MSVRSPNRRAVAPLEIEHIEDWAKVKEHKFSNMIILCSNCHGLKGDGPRKLDRKHLFRHIKANLGIINGRYGEWNAGYRTSTEHTRPANGNSFQVRIPDGLDLMLWYLIKDGTLVPQRDIKTALIDNTPLMQDYLVTEAGWELVAQLRDAQPVPL